MSSKISIAHAMEAKEWAEKEYGIDDVASINAFMRGVDDGYNEMLRCSAQQNRGVEIVPTLPDLINATMISREPRTLGALAGALAFRYSQKASGFKPLALEKQSMYQHQSVSSKVSA